MTQIPDHEARYLEARKRAEDQRIETRAQLLADLRAHGVTKLELLYDGYGDSGDVEEITPTPLEPKLPEEFNQRLNAFGWDFVYALSPGFENNEGGYGLLVWDIASDKIDVTHSDRYVESQTTEHEGL